MSDKQKVILEALIKLEFAINGLVRDAYEEKLPVHVMVVNNKITINVDQAQYQIQNLMDV